MPFAATRMELEMNILGEVSQTEKDKYYFISLICGIYNMTQRNLSTKSNSLINREQTCGCQKEIRVQEGWTESQGLTDANYYIL